MEVAAAVPGFVALAAGFAKTAVSLYRMAEAVKRARPQIERLASEARTFAHSLSDLEELFNSAEHPTRLSRNRKIRREIKRQGEYALGLLNGLLNKLKPLRSHTQYSRMQIVMAHVKWQFHTDDFRDIIASMDSTKTSATLLVTLCTLEQLVRVCAKQAADGQPISPGTLQKLFVASETEMSFVRLTITRKSQSLQIEALKLQMKGALQRLDKVEALAIDDRSIKILELTRKAQHEHVKLNPMLKTVLKVHSEDIDAGALETRLRRLWLERDDSQDHVGRRSVLSNGPSTAGATNSQQTELTFASSSASNQDDPVTPTLDMSFVVPRVIQPSRRDRHHRRPAGSVPTALFGEPGTPVNSPQSAVDASSEDEVGHVVYSPAEDIMLDEYRLPQRPKHPSEQARPGQDQGSTQR
jgi:hypothetical protein